MADEDLPPGCWRCPNSNCNNVVSQILLKCPNCEVVQPAFIGGLSVFLSHVASQQWLKSFHELRGQQQQTQYLQQYPEAHLTSQEHHFTSSSQRSGSIEEKHTAATTQQSIPNSSHTVRDPPAKTTTSSQQLYQQQCFFCANPQDFTRPSYNHCTKCNRRQPKNEPQGPLCDQRCGARLLSPDARICECCGRQQRPRAIIPEDEVQHLFDASLPGRAYSESVNGNAVQAPTTMYTGNNNPSLTDTDSGKILSF